MKRAPLAIALVAIFLFAAIGARLYYEQKGAQEQPLGMPTVQLKGQTIRVSVADTESAREKGLSGRTGLAPDEGMLFIFPEDGNYAFWMKDMLFSIDILWLSADERVVYMAENVSPDTYPQTFDPKTPARYVLELPAGYAKEYNVAIGDIVRL